MALTNEQKLQALKELERIRASKEEQKENEKTNSDLSSKIEEELARREAEKRILEENKKTQKKDNWYVEGIKKGTQAEKEALTGFGKGVLSTARGLSTVGEGILKGVGRILTPKSMEEKLGFAKTEKSSAQELISEEMTKPKTGYETLGKTVEQVGEFFIPAGAVSKVDKAIDLMIAGSKLSKGAKIASKVASTAALQGSSAAGVTLAQTGDKTKAAKAGLTAGAIAGTLRGVGEAARSIKIPEKLYSRIFKTKYNDFAGEVKVEQLAKIKEADPNRYAELLREGVIKEIGGKVTINETLAKQALDKGLKGSLQNMASEVYDDTLSLEMKAREAVRNIKTPITIKNSDKLANVLDDIAIEYKNVGAGEISDEAISYANSLRQGKLSGEDALNLRRLLDGMRVRSSFQSNQKLSLGQENMKYWSDAVRKKLSEIKGFSNIMEDYSFNIKALESLAREAARRDNKALLGLIDSIFFASGIAVGDVSGALAGGGIGAIRKAIESPTAMTNIGQALQKGTATKAGTVIKGLIGRGASEL